MSETELELNPDVLKEQSGNYSSLTDLYGVKVFTDDFTRQVEDLLREQEKQTEGYRQSVFRSDHYWDIATNSYETLLFQTTAQAERIQTYENAGESNSAEICIGLTVALLFVAGVYYLMNQITGKNKERQKGKGATI